MVITERDRKFMLARARAYRKEQPPGSRKWRMADRVVRRLEEG